MTPVANQAGDDRTDLLIVRHGEGRGRGRPFLQQALDHLAASDPGLSARIRLHETGSEVPDLDRVRAVVFWLADPLKELYPPCYRDAVRLADTARDRDIHLVNPPEALSNSIKSVQARLWDAAGVPTPPLASYATREELESVLDESEYPVIFRGDLLHSQECMHFSPSREAARSIPPEEIAYPGTVSPFIDLRQGYLAKDRDSVWTRFHHKKRSFVFGDSIVSNHVFFSPEPIVGLTTSTFFRMRGWRRHVRWLGSREAQRLDRTCLEIDNAFWASPPEHSEVMLRAARALDLDFAAIDYSVAADGRPILWEANPYFALHPWQSSLLPRERRLEHRIGGFLEAIGAFFHQLLGESRDA